MSSNRFVSARNARRSVARPRLVVRGVDVRADADADEDVSHARSVVVDAPRVARASATPRRTARAARRRHARATVSIAEIRVVVRRAVGVANAVDARRTRRDSDRPTHTKTRATPYYSLLFILGFRVHYYSLKSCFSGKACIDC
jgi:hypothetical protein